jgi:hypothetical protein
MPCTEDHDPCVIPADFRKMSTIPLLKNTNTIGEMCTFLGIPLRFTSNRHWPKIGYLCRDHDRVGDLIPFAGPPLGDAPGL